jgi:type VI secretion system protein ImpH
VTPEEYLQKLQEKPFDHDFFFALRKLETLHPKKPRTGTAARPQDEPGALRAGTFAGIRTLDDLGARAGGFKEAAAVAAAIFRIPWAQRCATSAPDGVRKGTYSASRRPHALAILRRFPSSFLALFYRAWSQAQPTASFDRPRDDRFADYVGSLVGIGDSSLHQRDAAGDHVKLFFSGWLSRQVRNSDGLASILQGYFGLPVRVENFVGHWMDLPESERTRLGQLGSGAQLGVGAVIGSRVWIVNISFASTLDP